MYKRSIFNSYVKLPEGNGNSTSNYSWRMPSRRPLWQQWWHRFWRGWSPDKARGPVVGSVGSPLKLPHLQILWTKHGENAFDFASQNPNCLEFDLLVSYSRKQNCCIIVTHIDFGSVTDFRSPKLWISTGIPRLIWVPKDFYRFLEALCQSLRGKIPRYPWLFNFVSTWAKAVSNAWFFHRGQRKTTWNTSLVGSVGFMSYRCFHNLGMGQDHRGDELIATILGFWPIAIGQNESN